MGILDAPTSQTGGTDLSAGRSRRPSVVPGSALASEPASPRARSRPRGAAAARAEPRLGSSRSARASVAGAPAEVGAPAAADLGECGRVAGGSRARSRLAGPGPGRPPRGRTRGAGRGRSRRACHAGRCDFLVPERLHPGLWFRMQQRRRSSRDGAGGSGEGAGRNAASRKNNNDNAHSSNNGCSPQTPVFASVESLASSQPGGGKNVQPRAEWGVDARGPGGPT